MSARIALPTLSCKFLSFLHFFLVNITSNCSSSIMYEPYCTCCYSSFNSNYINQCELFNINYKSNSNPISKESVTTSMDSKTKPIRRSKYIPHHLRPQHIVEKRNTRERRRVQDVNQAFLLLKELLPCDTHNDDKDQLNSIRISKVRTLRKAVEYIEALQNMLNGTN